MINRLLYCCKLAIRNISRYPVIFIIRIIFAIFLMIIMSIYLSLYFGKVSFFDNSSNFNEIESLNLYVADNYDEVPFNINSNDKIEFEMFALQDRIVNNNIYISNVSIEYISSDFDSVYKNLISDGNFISDISSECIIGEDVALKYDISLKNIINIGSHDYTVVGITNIPKYSSKILLCDPSAIQIGYPQMYYYRGNAKQIGTEKVYHANEINAYFKTFFQDGSFMMILIPCILIIIYSMIAYFNINKFYMSKTKTADLLKNHIGACKTDIFFQYMIENTIIFEIGAITAYLASFPTVAFIKKQFKYITLKFAFPSELLITITAFAFLIAIIVSCSKTTKDR